MTLLMEKAISHATAGLNAETADAMRTIYLITEPGNNRFADVLIAAAHNGFNVSKTVADKLWSYNYQLVNYDGSISIPVVKAIQHAIRENLLEVKRLLPPV